MSVTSALDLGVPFGFGGANGETETFHFLESFTLISPPNEGAPASEGRTRYMQPENEEYIVLSNCFNPVSADTTKQL